MKQFEAAEKFLELVKSRPEDFHASLDSGRDHSVYTISNLYRAVSINIDTHGGVLSVANPTSGKGIMYVSDAVLEELYNWSIGYIAQAKINDRINKDNAAMYELDKYYEDQRSYEDKKC